MHSASWSDTADRLLGRINAYLTVRVARVDFVKQGDTSVVDDIFEIPAYDEITFRYRCNCHMKSICQCSLNDRPAVDVVCLKGLGALTDLNDPGLFSVTAKQGPHS